MSATPTTAPLQSDGPVTQQGAGIPQEVYLITAPQDVSWEKGSKTREIEAYGTNGAYLSYGTTGLRKLNLNNCMVEGFSDGKQVEGWILSLEACQLMVISPDGFVSPYVWKVYAGSKSYGNYVITDVSISEVMRDMTGKATRAFADISLVEVPEAQVSSGADITAQAVTGSIDPKFQSELVAQDAAVASARAGGKPGSPGSPSAPGAPGSSSPNGSPSGSGAPQFGEEIYANDPRTPGRLPGTYTTNGIIYDSATGDPLVGPGVNK